MKLIHIQTIALKFRIKHDEIKEIARELQIQPSKYTKDYLELYNEDKANNIINHLIKKYNI